MKLNVMGFGLVFNFDFVRLHARCSCWSIVCLRFRVVQIKQVDCKMWIIFGQLYTQKYKAMEKQIVKLQLNEKKSQESQTRLMSWYWKRKPTWRKHVIIYNSHSCTVFSFNWLVIILSFGEEVGGEVVWNWTSKVKSMKEFWM